MDDANEAMIVPAGSPNSTPAPRVRIAAPGNDSAATDTYTAT